MKGNKHEEMAYFIWLVCLVAFLVVSIIGTVVRNW